MDQNESKMLTLLFAAVFAHARTGINVGMTKERVVSDSFDDAQAFMTEAFKRDLLPKKIPD